MVWKNLIWIQLLRKKEHDKEELSNIFELLDQEDLAIEGNFRLNSKEIWPRKSSSTFLKP